MIQRIQTVYMFVTALLMVLMIFLPLANFIGDTELFRLMAFGVESTTVPAAIDAQTQGYVVSTLYMGILIALCAAVPFVNIFLFKRRWLQVRLCIVEIVLLVGAQIYVGYYLYRSAQSVAAMEIHSISYSIVDVFPIVSIILSYLALRGIMRDQALLKSLDRIR